MIPINPYYTRFCERTPGDWILPGFAYGIMTASGYVPPSRPAAGMVMARPWKSGLPGLSAPMHDREIRVWRAESHGMPFLQPSKNMSMALSGMSMPFTLIIVQKPETTPWPIMAAESSCPSASMPVSSSASASASIRHARSLGSRFMFPLSGQHRISDLLDALVHTVHNMVGGMVESGGDLKIPPPVEAGVAGHIQSP